MSSTFTCPIRIGTRSTTSNEGVISPNTYGGAVCSQQAVFEADGEANMVIPAGSIVHSVTGYINDTGTSRDVFINEVNSGTLTTSAAGVVNAVFNSIGGLALFLANPGDTDITFRLSSEASSSGVVSIMYTPRNANGTLTPYGEGLSNN